jgi:hypothetical protein
MLLLWDMQRLAASSYVSARFFGTCAETAPSAGMGQQH